MSDRRQPPASTDPFTRRAFIAAGAATAGAAMLAAGERDSGAVVGPPKAKATKGRGPNVPKDDQPILIGVIGTGGMGTGHCNAIMNLAKEGKENVQIVALSDVNQIRLDAARSACESTQGRSVDTYGDYRKLLERDDLNGVLIATPEHWHARNAADAIMAGKDVYLEKPMTLDLADALYLRGVAQANPGMILQVGTQMTQLPKYQAARKMVAEGQIGTPVWSQTSYCRNSKKGEWLYYAIDPDWKPGQNLDWDMWCGPLGAADWDPTIYARWRRYKKYSTGIIGDLLVHVMTPLTMAVDAGWPTRVIATGGHHVDKAMENFDQVNLTITFENGHTMVVAGSTCNEVGLETMIRGHQGNLYLGGRHCEFRPERIFVEDGLEQQRVDCPDIGNDQDQHRLSWLRSMRTREQHESDVDLGTKIMVIVDLATRSMWEGGAYAFDPAKMTAWRV